MVSAPHSIACPYDDPWPNVHEIEMKWNEKEKEKNNSNNKACGVLGTPNNRSITAMCLYLVHGRLASAKDNERVTMMLANGIRPTYSRNRSRYITTISNVHTIGTCQLFARTFYFSLFWSKDEGKKWNETGSQLHLILFALHYVNFFRTHSTLSLPLSLVPFPDYFM